MKATWLPRSPASRGVRSDRPWPPQRDSTSSMNSAVSAIDFSPQRGEPAVAPRRPKHVDAALERRQRQHRRRAADEPRDAGAGTVVGREREGCGVAEPAGQRLTPLLAIHARGVVRMSPDEGRRPGAAVEVFVAAAHREVGCRALPIVAVQVHRHRTGRMRQVPDHQRARRRGPRASSGPSGACARCGNSRASAAAPPVDRRDGGESPRRRPARARSRARWRRYRRCTGRWESWSARKRFAGGRVSRRRPSRRPRSGPCRDWPTSSRPPSARRGPPRRAARSCRRRAATA